DQSDLSVTILPPDLVSLAGNDVVDEGSDHVAEQIGGRWLIDADGFFRVERHGIASWATEKVLIAAVEKNECRFSRSNGEIKLESEVARLLPQLLRRWIDLRERIDADECIRRANLPLETGHVGGQLAAIDFKLYIRYVGKKLVEKQVQRGRTILVAEKQRP